MCILESWKNSLTLTKETGNIILLEKYPEMSQSDMAEKLKISQPQSAQDLQIKQKALSPCCGMNLKKVASIWQKSM